MAPSSGHLLMPKIMRIIKFGISQTKAVIKSRLPGSNQTTISTGQYSLQPVRNYARNQPIHPLAYLKQSRSQNNRGFSTINRLFTSAKSTGPVRYDRSNLPVSKISKVISQRGAAPFASTLRPNLAGGALPRSAGGYGLSGAGARHFSHTSGVKAQVVQDVSAGIRAFSIGGGKARFDGVDPITGEKRFRAVSQMEQAVYTQWESPNARSMKGTTLEFKLSPTITALSPSFTSAFHDEKDDITSPNEINLLDTLATDFARALKDLAAVLVDLRRLSLLGDLPISLAITPSGPILGVRFPGCDADAVSRLCDEVGVRRGVVVEDEGWTTGEKDVEMALLFPFAPTIDGMDTLGEYENGGEYFETKPLEHAYQPEDLDWRQMLSPSARTPSRAETLHSYATLQSPPWETKSPSGYESLRESDFTSDDPYYHSFSPLKAPTHSMKSASADYEGLEGIYKFLQVCEDSRR